MDSSIASSLIQIRCKGLLFDMDGILVSSLGAVERAWTRWAQMRGVDPAYACSIAHGCLGVDTVARLRPDLDPVAEDRIIEGMEIKDTAGITPLPGVLALLSSLPPDRWTVVTSATQELARVRLGAGSIPAPARIITAECITHGKPHPEPYLAGAMLLGLAPEDCVVFEDAPAGAKAGRTAGCTVLATTFSHPVEALAAAHFLVPDLAGVTAEATASGDEISLRFTPLAV